MTNIDKIRQEIERRQKYNRHIVDNAINSNMLNFYYGEEDCCKQLLSFIDSLPDEKPSDDLEEAAEKFARSYDQGTCDGIAQDCFIAGAKWQKTKDDEETADLMTIVALDAGQRARESMPMPEDTVIFMKGVEETKAGKGEQER